MKKPVTLWTKLIPSKNLKKSKWEFNHLEDGYSKLDKPTPYFDSQKSWSKSVWKKEYAHLINNKVVKDN